MGFFRKRYSPAGHRRLRLNLSGKWTNVTGFLVTAIVVLFVFTYGNRPTTQEPSGLAEMLSVSYSAIAAGQVWRVLCAPFLFSGMLQLFFGAAAIYFFGGYVARRLGFAWFMFAYLACGATGGLAASLIAPGRSFDACTGATCGIIFMCMLYFPYMYFLGGATAKQLGPVLMGAIVLCSLSFGAGDLGYLAQLLALPVAYGIFKLEPVVQRMRGRWRLRKEIAGAFTEAQREEQLDRLLQKVAREGMDSLNRKEKHFLQTVSKDYRRKKVKNNH